jgi:hypothetical protein
VNQLAIRKFDEHQHYKNRPGMPWVKFYVEQLDDEKFVGLSESTRLIACLLLLVAQRRDNRIPDSAAWLEAEVNVPRAKCRKALDDLTEIGFLVASSEVSRQPSRQTASGSSSNGASKLSSPRARPRALSRTEQNRTETAEQSSYVVEMPAAALPNESLEELGQRLEAATPATPNGRSPYGSVDSVYEVIDKPAKNTRPELEKWLGQLEPHQVEHVREQVLACEPRKSKAAYAVGTAQKLARERGAA